MMKIEIISTKKLARNGIKQLEAISKIVFRSSGFADQRVSASEARRGRNTLNCELKTLRGIVEKMSSRLFKAQFVKAVPDKLKELARSRFANPKSKT